MVRTMNRAVIGKQSEDITKELVASVAAILGDIGARLQIVEMALAQDQKSEFMMPEKVDNSEVVEPFTAQLSCQLPNTIALLPDILSSIENFHYAETTDDGYEYTWTGEAAATNMELLVSRTNEKEIRIRIVSMVKEDALQDLRIEVDGVETPFQWVPDGDLHCISVLMPVVLGKMDSTTLSIVYPEPCTPESLGISIDNRHIGLAINSISVVDNAL